MLDGTARPAWPDAGGPAGGAPTVIFPHLLKTGGVTLRTVLLRNYAHQVTRVISGRYFELGKIKNLEQALCRSGAPPKLILGHIPFGIHSMLPPGTSAYITLIRNPVSRMKSLYYYLLGRQTPEMYDGGRTLTIAEYVRRGKSRRNQDFELDNAQVRRLSGLSPAFGGCSRDMLDLARENLRRHFAAVGLTERFDESLLLMKRTFGWDHLLYARGNESAYPPGAGLSNEDVDAIRERNAFDVELYEDAVALFEERVRGEGPSFEQEVRAFQRANEAYARGALTVDAGPEAPFWAGLVREHLALTVARWVLERKVNRARRHGDASQAESERAWAQAADLAEQLEQARGRADELAKQLRQSERLRTKREAKLVAVTRKAAALRERAAKGARGRHRAGARGPGRWGAWGRQVRAWWAR